MVQVDSRGNVYDGVANLLIPRRAYSINYSRRKIDGSLYCDPRGSKIKGYLALRDMQIMGDAHLNGLRVKGPAHFRGMRINGRLSLDEGQFLDSVDFRDMQGGGEVDVHGTQFGDIVMLDKTTHPTILQSFACEYLVARTIDFDGRRVVDALDLTKMV